MAKEITKKTASSNGPVLPSDIDPKSLEITRTIDLRLEDYPEGVWLPIPFQEVPPPAPFVLEDCLAKIDAMNGHVDWQSPHLLRPVSRQEAHFWLTVLLEAPGRVTAPFRIQLSKSRFDGDVCLTEVLNSKTIPYGYVGIGGVLLFYLFPAVDVWQQFIKLSMGSTGILGTFAKIVLPYLPESERVRLRDFVSATLANLDPISHPYAPQLSTLFALASILNLQQVLLGSIESLPTDYFARTHPWNAPVFLSLTDSNQVVRHVQRLGVRPCSPQELAVWLIRTEFDCLDQIFDAIARQSSKKDAEYWAGPLLRVRAPELAPTVLKIKLRTKAIACASRWLEENLGNAIVGLIPTAARDGELKRPAIDFLREACSRGLRDLVNTRLADHEPDVAGAIRKDVLAREKETPSLNDEDLPDWLRIEVKSSRSRLPSWAHPSLLPELPLKQWRVGDEHVMNILAALRQSTLEVPHPLVSALRANIDRNALALFAWGLFDAWQENGSPNSDKWAFVAQGLLGNDLTAHKLAPLIRAWPRQSLHKRAVLGLDLLRTIGSDAALMNLHAIAYARQSQHRMQERAKELIDAIAAERGLTVEQLEDRVVPDCGLDERGGKTFDFGSRQFSMAIGSDLKPMIRDQEGKVRANLPKPGKSDDAEKSARSVRDWQVFKKQLGTILKTQADRLKAAMIHQRRWSIEEFERFFVRHPLMLNLTRLLVWGGYNDQDDLLETFRVTQERAYEDHEEKPLRLNSPTVGIVHPYLMSDEMRTTWGQLFSDYEIIQPFLQLGRPVYRLEQSESQETQIRRLQGLKIPAASLVFPLDNLGWTKGFQERTKSFPKADVTAVIRHEPGIEMGPPSLWPDQEVTHCYFEQGQIGSSGPDPKKAMKLCDVDPLAVTEVLNDLMSVGKHAR